MLGGGTGCAGYPEFLCEYSMSIFLDNISVIKQERAGMEPS